MSITGFDDKIVAMYARGMTVREIRGFLAEQYGTEVGPEFISSATDAGDCRGQRLAEPSARADVPSGVLRCAAREDSRRGGRAQQSDLSGWLRRRVGSEALVLVDAIEHDRASGQWRSAAEAPEADGVVYVALSGEADAQAYAPGSEMRVRIVDTDEHDLIAVPLDRTC